MSKAILIQQVYKNSEYTEALALTFERNISYCKKWDIDYSVQHSNVVDEWDMKFGGSLHAWQWGWGQTTG